jgi:hypothetical protein
MLYFSSSLHAKQLPFSASYRGLKDGCQRVLNWYCKEDEDKQIQDADFCG